MIGSAITTTWRTTTREIGYVGICVLSLAIAAASAMLIALYVRDQWTFDKHNVNQDNIYRLIVRYTTPGQEPNSYATSPPGLGPLIGREFPDFGTVVRFAPITSITSSNGLVSLQHGDISHAWKDSYFVDPDVFKLFTHQVLHGDPATALLNPNSIAISESVATSYFGDSDPVGQSLHLEGHPLLVTLVFRDVPRNSHLRYDVLVPIALDESRRTDLNRYYMDTVFSVRVYTYVMPEDGVTSMRLQELASDFVSRRLTEQSRRFNQTLDVEFQPLLDVHFGERLETDLPIGNPFYVLGLLAIGVFVVSIGCINYTNLSLARAVRRSREIGMRRVLGATRSQLAAHFLGESLALSLLATAIAAAFVAVATTSKGVWSWIFGASARNEGITFTEIGLCVAVCGVVGLAAGIYPAFRLSGIPPLRAVADAKVKWSSRISIRQVLLAIQLMVAMTVLACAVVMYVQLHRIYSTPLGFEKSDRFVVTLRGYDTVQRSAAIVQAIRGLAFVKNASMVGSTPGIDYISTSVQLESEAAAGERVQIPVHVLLVGRPFIQTMGISLLEGRDFSDDLGTDLFNSLIVNEAAVRAMGWEQPLGKLYYRPGIPPKRVIGVVKDFHYRSLHETIEPLLMFPLTIEEAPNITPQQKPSWTQQIVVALESDAIGAARDGIESVLAGFDPSRTFDVQDLRNVVERPYLNDRNLMRTVAVFALACLGIAVAGVYGTASYMLGGRRREFAIRQILGISRSQLAILVVRPLALIAVVASIPAAIATYLIAMYWSDAFVYRVPFSWAAMACSMSAVVLVVAVAISRQVWTATRADLAPALKTE